MRTKIRRLHVTFVRHALSIDNEAWRNRLPWPGVRDAPLSQKGKESLGGIAATLAPWGPEVVISSPLTRCIETAKAICETTQAILSIDYALTETYHTDGDLPMSPEQLKLSYANVSVIPPGNESRSTADRAIRFLASLGRFENCRICLVGHRDWLRTISGRDIENGEAVVLDIVIYFKVSFPMNAKLISIAAI